MKSVIRQLIRGFLNRLSSQALSRVINHPFCPTAWRYYVDPGKDLRVFIQNEFFHGTTVFVDTVYPIEKQLLTRGVYDKPLLLAMKSLIRQGDTIVDIGANIGAISIPMAYFSGPAGQVISFEPGPINYSRLSRNIQANPKLAGRIHLIRMGISDREEELFWQEESHNRGNAFFHESEGEKMLLSPLTTAFQQHQLGSTRIHVMKIDVEGMELKVIRGALDLIMKDKPSIVYETWVGLGKDEELQEIERILESAGYEFFSFSPENHLKPTRFPNLEQNTIAIHPNNHAFPR